MADIGLYANLIERARLEEAHLYRRRLKNLREPEREFEMPDTLFVGLYRLRKQTVRELVQEIEPFMPPRIAGHGITNVAKVLAALNFYASGSYQRFVGVGANMHQTTVSHCLRDVNLALNRTHFRRYLAFPQTRQERNVVMQGFYDKFNIPGVLGCVDGTHVGIVRPSDFEERYLNRKGYHSINAQIICNSDLKIMNIDASHGGRNHDSFIWSQHPIKHHLEQLFQTENESAWLLGDSGYPLRAYLLTPIVHTEPNTPEHLYTNLHCKVRNCVERCIGVLKARWRCLLVHRILHYDPNTAGYITNACAILHNIAIESGVPAPEMPEIDRQNEAALQIIHENAEAALRQGGRNAELAAGEATRRSLINRMFN